MKVAIVAVCYNAYDDSVGLLDSIDLAMRTCEFLDLHVIVCDNSNKSKGLEGLKEKLKKLKFNYVKLDNVGYFPAFFAGKKLLDNITGIRDWDFVVVTNVDLQFDDSFFKNLKGISISSDVGVLAPSILSKETSEDINPKIFKRPSKFKLSSLYYGFQFLWFYRFYSWLSVSRAKLRGSKRNTNSYRSYSSGTEMYAAHGSIMLFTKFYFNQGASIDYPRFLFGEEVFVAEESRLKGLKTIYTPELKIYDKEHGSTSKEADKFISLEHVKSYKYLLDSYF